MTRPRQSNSRDCSVPPCFLSCLDYDCWVYPAPSFSYLACGRDFCELDDYFSRRATSAAVLLLPVVIFFSLTLMSSDIIRAPRLVP